MEKMKNRENKKFGCQNQSGRGEAGGGGEGDGGGGRGREWKHNVEGHVLITKHNQPDINEKHNRTLRPKETTTQHAPLKDNANRIRQLKMKKEP